MTDREFAYLRITGNGSHQKVTEILGREPSKAWSEGDPRPRKGHYQFMCWCLNSGYDDREPLEKHIEGLLFMCNAMGDKLRSLSPDYKAFISCVGYYPNSGHGLYLRHEWIKTASHLGLEFDCDFYFVSEEDEENG